MGLKSWSHFHRGKESHWVQMGLHSQVKLRWVYGSLKGKIGCQRLLTYAWTRLCGYLLPNREDDICAVMVSLAATYQWPFHQLNIKNIFSIVLLMRKFIRSNHQLCFSGGVWAESLQVEVIYCLKQSPRA